MTIIKTDDFDRAFKKLSKHIQSLYPKQENVFIENWHDPRLHIKKIESLPLALSFRITRHYRVLFYFRDSTTAIFFATDHRKHIYR